MKKTTSSKKYLKSYSPGTKIIGGVAIATTVIVASYFGFRYYTSRTTAKPTEVKSVAPSNASQTTNTPKTKPSPNGKYAGTSSVAQGISEATDTVSGTSLTGTAVYVGDFNARIPGIKITGQVTDTSTDSQARANIIGTFSGSGNVMGQTVTVSGNFQGNIINTSMNVSYSAASNFGTYPGQITLSKQ